MHNLPLDDAQFRQLLAGLYQAQITVIKALEKTEDDSIKASLIREAEAYGELINYIENENY